MMLDDTTLRILACQIDVPSMTTSAERDAHLRTSAVKVRKELAKTDVDLVALPELSSIDYARETFANLEDIATLTGGKVMSPKKGMKLQNFDADWFGTARSVTINNKFTTIIDGVWNQCNVFRSRLALKTSPAS